MNTEKYNKLHAEIMKRLENGEITIETAREVNDLAFDKYITESFSSIIKKIRDSRNMKKYEHVQREFYKNKKDEIDNFWDTVHSDAFDDAIEDVIKTFFDETIDDRKFTEFTGMIMKDFNNYYTYNSDGSVKWCRLMRCLMCFNDVNDNVNAYTKLASKLVRKLSDKFIIEKKYNVVLATDYDRTENKVFIFVYKDIGDDEYTKESTDNETVKRKIQLKPLVGMDEIKFGMSRDSIRKIIGNDNSEFKKTKTSKVTTDDFGFCHVFYNDENKCNAIEIFEDKNIEVTINSKVVLPGTVNNIKSVIKDLEGSDLGFISKSKSVGITTDNENIKSILIGVEDYYN